VRNDQGHLVIEDISDFNGYEIVFHEEHKPGVFKVGLKKDLKEIAQFKIAFCKNKFMPIDIDAHNKYWVSQ
jgi:hypothetical protein